MNKFFFQISKNIFWINKNITQFIIIKFRMNLIKLIINVNSKNIKNNNMIFYYKKIIIFAKIILAG